MPKTFIFVEKHDGLFIPFKQNSLKDQFEKTHSKAFDGACVGVVAAVLELFITPLKANYQFFNPASKPPFLPSASRCIYLQREYEEDIENFFTIFIRDKLKVNKTGFTEREGFGANPKEILNKFSRHGMQKNELILMKAIYNLQSKETTYNLEHKLCLLKLNDQYIFCEPNYGVVIFNSLDDINEWLSDEMTHGALEHYVKPVVAKMVIPSHIIKEQGRKEEGILTVNSVFFESFTFSIKSNLQAYDTPKIQSRL